MYPKVKSVIPNDNYILTITFSNNEVGTLDMKPYLDFGIFKRIKDHTNFKSVRVAFDTIEWPFAGVDLDPEFVYQKCKKVPNEALQPDRPTAI